MVRSKFTLNDEYFREDLEQWIKHVSRGRKYEPLLIALAFIVGGVLFWLDIGSVTKYVCLGIGAVQTANYFFWRQGWLKARRAHKYYGQEIELTFDDGKVAQVVPEPESQVVQEVHKIVEATKGFFIYFQPNQHFYVPDSSLQPSGKRADILSSLRR